MRIFLVILLGVFAFENQDQNTYAEDTAVLEVETEKNEESLTHELSENQNLNPNPNDESKQIANPINEENTQKTNNDEPTNSIQHEINSIEQEVNTNEDNPSEENSDDFSEQLLEEGNINENNQLKTDEILESKDRIDAASDDKEDLQSDEQENPNCANGACIFNSEKDSSIEVEQVSNEVDSIQENKVLEQQENTNVEKNLEINENAAEILNEENSSQSVSEKEIDSQLIPSSSDNAECSDESCKLNSNTNTELVRESPLDQENASSEHGAEEEGKKDNLVEEIIDQNKYNEEFTIEALEQSKENTNIETLQDENNSESSPDEINREELKTSISKEIDQNENDSETKYDGLNTSEQDENNERSKIEEERNEADSGINQEEPNVNEYNESKKSINIEVVPNTDSSNSNQEEPKANEQYKREESIKAEEESNKDNSGSLQDSNALEVDKSAENLSCEGVEEKNGKSCIDSHGEAHIDNQLTINKDEQLTNIKEMDFGSEAAEKSDSIEQVSDTISEENQLENQNSDVEANPEIISTDKQSDIISEPTIISDDQTDTANNAEKIHNDETPFLDIDQVDFKVLFIKFALRTENMISSVYLYIRNKQPYNIIIFYFCFSYIIYKIFDRRGVNHSFSYKIVEEKQQSTITQIIDAKNKELEKMIVSLKELTKTDLDNSQIDKIKNKLNADLKDKFSDIKKEISIIHEKQNEFQSQILSSHQDIWMKIDSLKEGPEEIPYVSITQVAVSMHIPDKPRELNEGTDKKNEEIAEISQNIETEFKWDIENKTKDSIEIQNSNPEAQFIEQKNHKTPISPPIQHYKEEPMELKEEHIQMDYLKFPTEITESEEQKLTQKKETNLGLAQEELETKINNLEEKEEQIENKLSQLQGTTGAEKPFLNPPKPKIPIFAPPGFKPVAKISKVAKVEPEKKPQKLPETRSKVISQPFIQKSPFAQL